MKIFNAEQIKAWDQYTVRHEPVSSIDLMERAAIACTRYMLRQMDAEQFHILCGPGNNGGDGLAVARQLREAGKTVTVYLSDGDATSENHRTNKARWTALGGKVESFETFLHTKPTLKHAIVDAMFGTGSNRALDGIFAAVVRHANESGLVIVSIDMPSGMMADQSSVGRVMIMASTTLTLGSWKLALLMPENGPYCGKVHCLPIGLHPGYVEQTATAFHLTEANDIRQLLVPRNRFAHKGDFGNAMLLAGSQHMMGAAILAATACLRSGVGKLYCGIPANGLLAMQTSLPEAICVPDPHAEHLSKMPGLDHISAVGAGPGMGQHPETAALMKSLLKTVQIPMVLDADALNIIAANKWQDKLGKGTVITPHVGEFHRLFNAEPDGFARIMAALRLSTSHELCIIIKGHYSFLSTAGGQGYFNTTGNPGMAKAGTGDVLTGIILGLLAQKYSVDAASRVGMYIHGLAGDLASRDLGEPSVLASDIILRIGKAFEAILQL